MNVVAGSAEPPDSEWRSGGVMLSHCSTQLCGTIGSPVVSVLESKIVEFSFPRYTPKNKHVHYK